MGLRTLLCVPPLMLKATATSPTANLWPLPSPLPPLALALL